MKKRPLSETSSASSANKALCSEATPSSIESQTAVERVSDQSSEDSLVKKQQEAISRLTKLTKKMSTNMPGIEKNSEHEIQQRSGRQFSIFQKNPVRAEIDKVIAPLRKISNLLKALVYQYGMTQQLEHQETFRDMYDACAFAIMGYENFRLNPHYDKKRYARSGVDMPYCNERNFNIHSISITDDLLKIITLQPKETASIREPIKNSIKQQVSSPVTESPVSPPLFTNSPFDLYRQS